MGVRIIVGTEYGTSRVEMAAIYDSVTDTALGPMFYAPDDDCPVDDPDYCADACDVAQLFLDWLANDARTYTQAELLASRDVFLRERAERLTVNSA